MAREWPRVPKGGIAWSYSQLQDWRCDLHGHMRRDLRQQDLTSPALYLGRLAHDFVARYCEHLMTHAIETDSSVVDRLAREVYFGADGGEAHGLGLEGWPEMLGLARRFAEDFSLPTERVIASEEIWLPNLHGPHYMYVICDLVLTGEASDEAVVLDFKSDAHLRSQEEVEEDPQLRIYAWGVAKRFSHIKKVRCFLMFLRYGKYRMAEFGPADIAQTDQELRDEIARIEAVRASKKFTASPGQCCTYCAFTAECPAVKKAPELVRITSPEEALEVAGALTAIDRRRSVLTKALNQWTSEAGPVEVGGVEWGHLLSEGVTVPADQVRPLVESLQKSGLDPWPLLRVDTQQIRAMAARDTTAAIVDPFLVDSSSTQFRCRKAKPRKEAAAG